MKLQYIVAALFSVLATSTACSDSSRAKDVTDLTSAGPPSTPGTTPSTVQPATATPAPVATTPSSPSASTGPGLSGLALVSDDYTRYSNTAAFLTTVSSNVSGGTGDWQTALYHDGAHAELAQIDPSVTYNGHPTLKYNFPGGVSDHPELWPTLPRPLSTMWLRVKIRYGPGFTTAGTLTNSSNAYKLLGWGYADSYGSGRVEITNTTQYQLYYVTSVTGTNNGTSTPPDFAIGGDINTEWSDGGWYDYIVEYRNTSATTSVARLWIAKDGSTPVLKATSTSTSLPGFTMSHIGYVMLGMNFNQIRAANQTQALWYGQWEVVDGDQHPNPFGLAGNY